jgi:hypothetical protein
MRAALLLLILTISTGDLVASGIPRFHDAGCGVSFEHPHDLSVHRLKGPRFDWNGEGKQPLCSFGITYPGWSEYRKASIFDVPEYPVTVDFYDGGLEEIAQIAGFTPMDAARDRVADLNNRDLKGTSQWLTPSRGSRRPANPFAIESRIGIRGIGWSRIRATDRCKPELESCIGSVFYERAVVCEDEKCAIVQTEDHDEFEDVVDCIVSSVALGARGGI